MCLVNRIWVENVCTFTLCLSDTESSALDILGHIFNFVIQNPIRFIAHHLLMKDRENDLESVAASKSSSSFYDSEHVY